MAIYLLIPATLSVAKVHWFIEQLKSGQAISAKMCVYGGGGALVDNLIGGKGRVLWGWVLGLHVLQDSRLQCTEKWRRIKRRYKSHRKS